MLNYLKSISMGGDIKVHFTAFSRFHQAWYIEGHLSGVKGELSANIESKNIVGTPIFSKEQLGNGGTKISFLFLTSSNAFPSDILLKLECNGKSLTLSADNIREKYSDYPSANQSVFFDSLKNTGRKLKVLDIGGRARSGLLRSKFFPENCEVTVLDILPDEGVDVVGDAHELSKFFPAQHFDAIFSQSVFEHILMPWVVVSEMNKVLKNDGLIYIATHQTLGLHDMPCDFYRYSDTSWNGLFNTASGFEVIKAEMSGLMYIIPFLYSESMDCAEKSAGFANSTVLAKKTQDREQLCSSDFDRQKFIVYPE